MAFFSFIGKLANVFKGGSAPASQTGGAPATGWRGFLAKVNPFGRKTQEPIPVAEEFVPPTAEESFKQFFGDADDWVYGGHWLNVTSSNVQAIRYHFDANVMDIQYLNGGMYSYMEMTPPEAAAFYRSTSYGTAVWDKLRVRGTVFGFKKPYTFASGLSNYQPKWMAQPHWRRDHGAIKPGGETTEDMHKPWYPGRGWREFKKGGGKTK